MVYLALGTAGLPVWSGHIGGAQIWTTPRAGFLLAFVLAAFVTGWMAERLAAARLATFAGFLGAASVGALGIITVLGWAFFGIRAQMSFDDTLTTLTPFLPGDIIKAFVAAAVASAVHAAYPEILLAPTRSLPVEDLPVSGSRSPRRTGAR